MYNQVAKQNLGRFFGIEGFFAKVQEKGHKAVSKLSLIGSAIKLTFRAAKMQAKMEQEKQAVLQKQPGATPAQSEGQESSKEVPEEDREPTEEEAKEMMGILNQGLKLMWEVGVQELEECVRSVCEALCESKDRKDKQLCSKRAEAIKMLGEMFMEESEKRRKEEERQKELAEKQRKAATSRPGFFDKLFSPNPVDKAAPAVPASKEGETSDQQHNHNSHRLPEEYDQLNFLVQAVEHQQTHKKDKHDSPLPPQEAAPLLHHQQPQSDENKQEQLKANNVGLDID